jgi:hypothetical protein
VFVCIVLTLGAIYFNKDANKLVVTPIERMIDRVKRIAKNPLGYLTEQSGVGFFELEKNAEEKGCCGRKLKNPIRYETEVLEDTIVKIGALLAIGFGEAGSSIIATNFEKEGDVNPLTEGRKIIAIFGFCDIR